MKRRLFLAGAALSLALPARALAQGDPDWCFRVTSGSAADFAADLNAMAAANGWAFPLLPASGWNGQQSVAIADISRMDFDVFEIVINQYNAQGQATSSDDRGLHVNARLAPMPGADPTQAAETLAFWEAAITAWFGGGGTQPACPSLTTYTNSAPAEYPSNGGQVWQSTGKTALVSPAPTVRKRLWA